MKAASVLTVLFCLLLAACTAAAPSSTPTVAITPTDAPTRTPRNLMLPTWTPSPTPLLKPSPTPRDTPTPRPSVAVNALVTPTSLSTELLIDRPASALLAKPANLVTLEYDPNLWMLNSYYASDFMGYSLGSRTVYGCKLEPVVPQPAEGYQVENYSHQFGASKFDVTRLSQASELSYADYCTGAGEDATCYRMTPGDDHTACTAAAETVLSTYKLVPNPWFGRLISSSNHWVCQDASGTPGLCLISYSVPLNALAFTPGNSGWAAGDDGLLLQQEGTTWKEADSPASHPLYDLAIASLSSGWAVGDGAQLLKWDENTWSEVLPYHGPGEGPGGSTQALFGVDAATKDDAWMVGLMKGVDGKNRPYALHWDGKDLLEENTFPDCNCGLNAVLVKGKDDVYAAGGSDMGAVVFHWDGTQWSSTVLPGADHLYALIEAPDGTLWTGGIEIARDQSDTRGALFHWDGSTWQRVATPPLTGGIYALSALPTGQVVLGGDFTALRDGLDWQPITTDIAGYGWIADIAQDAQGVSWAVTHSGNLFKLVVK